MPAAIEQEVSSEKPPLEPIISSELADITPDEALKELVSSDVIGDAKDTMETENPKETTPADISVADPSPSNDEMATEADSVNDTEAAPMEAAPIKPDDEEMDIDESNSVDAMDL